MARDGHERPFERVICFGPDVIYAGFLELAQISINVFGVIEHVRRAGDVSKDLLGRRQVRRRQVVHEFSAEIGRSRELVDLLRVAFIKRLHRSSIRIAHQQRRRRGRAGGRRAIFLSSGEGRDESEGE